jgi:glycerol-3-phosphate acyltransferase PlsY
MAQFIIFLLLAYFIGSIPFDYLIGKKFGGVDIRKVGSGNAGATNLKRILGLPGFLAGLTCDAIKGVLPVLIGNWLGLPVWQLTLLGLTAILGHLFPIFLGFKGGKGVATTTGVMLLLSPTGLAIAFAVWLTVYLATRYVSLGSILGAFTLVGAQIIIGGAWTVKAWPITTFSCLMLVVVLISHRDNIIRLWHGDEKRA